MSQIKLSVALAGKTFFINMVPESAFLGWSLGQPFFQKKIKKSHLYLPLNLLFLEMGFKGKNLLFSRKEGSSP